MMAHKDKDTENTESNICDPVPGVFRRERERLELSLRAMGNLLDYSHQHVSNIESGVASPTTAELWSFLLNKDRRASLVARRVIRAMEKASRFWGRKGEIAK